MRFAAIDELESALAALDLQKPPGLAETIDRAHALTALGEREPDAENVRTTQGSVFKYHEDLSILTDALAVRAACDGRPLKTAPGATHAEV